MKRITVIIALLLFSFTSIMAQNTGRTGFAASEKVNQSYSILNETYDDRSVECDTLRYPLPGTIIYYYLLPPGVGYITGNNSYLDKTKAEYFSSFEVGTTINGLIADFAVAKNTNSPQVTFGIWNNAGTNGKPGALVASTTKSLASLVTDYSNGTYSTITFDQPYTVTGPFYAGVVLPTVLGDTLALWCRQHVAGYSGTAWEQWSNGSWYSFNDPESYGTGMQTSMTIHPITCKTVGINDQTDPEASIHPNPANGIVNITTWKSSEKISLDIITLSGQTVFSRAYPGAITNFNIDLGTLPNGIYMVHLSDGKRQHTQKLIME